MIIRDLYGLNSAGAIFQNHLADCMKHMEYILCLADPDLWMKPMVIPSDGTKYYAYILLYVDDILCIHHDTKSVLAKVDKYFQLKPDSIRDPDMYLGDKSAPMKLDNGVCSWDLSPSHYVQERFRNVQKYVKNNLVGRWKLQSPNHTHNLFAMGYAPELDTSPVLDTSLASYYQSQIGVF